METFYALEYQLNERGLTEYGTWGHAIYRTEDEAKRRMESIYGTVKEGLVDEYRLEESDLAEESSPVYRNLSAGEDISFRIEVVELREEPQEIT